MKIPDIDPGTKFFKHPTTKGDFKFGKDRLLENQPVPKDRVTISPDARIPDHEPQQPIIRPGIPSFYPPFFRRPRLSPPPHLPPRFRPPIHPPEDGRPRIPEEGPRLEPPPSNPGPIQPHPGIGRPSINPSDDFTIPEELLESIKQGIADKLSVPVEDITIVDQKQVSWSDTSLGNPQPGGVYAQVIVPGYKITVQAGEDKQVSEFYAVLDPGGDQLQGIVGPDPFSGQPPVVAIPEQPFPPLPPIPEHIPESIMAEQSKWDNLRKTANDNPFQKALIETLAEREEWKAIKTALHRKGDKEGG